MDERGVTKQYRTEYHDSAPARKGRLALLQRHAFVENTHSIHIINGVGSHRGQYSDSISLKTKTCDLLWQSNRLLKILQRVFELLAYLLYFTCGAKIVCAYRSSPAVVQSESGLQSRRARSLRGIGQFSPRRPECCISTKSSSFRRHTVLLCFSSQQVSRVRVIHTKLSRLHNFF